MLVLLLMMFLVFQDYTKADEYSEEFNILTNEGKPGWLQKVIQNSPVSLENVKRASPFTKNNQIDDLKTRELEGPPTPLINNWVRNVDKELGKEEANKMKTITQNMVKDWKSKSYNERHAMTTCLQSAAKNLGRFANTKDDPVQSIIALMDVVGSFAMVFGGPYGQAIGAALPFVSAFLSMFGKGKEKPESMESIVKRQINHALELYYEKTLSNEAQGAIFAFQTSQTFLSGVGVSGKTLSSDEANSLSSHVPVYQGVSFMGKLAAEIGSLLGENSYDTFKSRKCLKYMELYAQLATFKDTILLEMAALLPESHSNIKNGILHVHNSLRVKQKNMMEFLYKSDYTKNILPHYDPDIYPSINTACLTVLNIPNYDRSMKGLWCLKLENRKRSCLTPKPGPQRLPPRCGGYLTWQTGYSKLLFHGKPYTAYEPSASSGCFWYLIPHGKDLFSIVNKYDCPNNGWCNAMLTWNGVGNGKYRAHLSDTEGLMFEISKNSAGMYRIRNKYGCPGNPDKCDKDLGEQIEVAGSQFGRQGTRYIYKVTGGLRSDVGYNWKITDQE